jgi:hypothetical protein
MSHWVEPPAGTFSARLRPFAIVDSLDDLRGPEAGRIRLPGRLWWSEPRHKSWDLSDPADLNHLYGLLLREAEPDDLSVWVNRARLLECWDQLVLPSYVRACWQPLIAAARASAS